MSIRSKLPKVGGRKVYHMIQEDLINLEIKMGRDKLFDYLRHEHLLVPKRKKYYKTTNSRHWMRKYPNLIKNISIIHPEQLWVADITYLQVQNKHYYLHLLTDAYSKKIVGYQLADNLLATTTLKALEQALKNRKYNYQIIHHSDRGLQYCSSEYTNKLMEHKLRISMTEKYDPYENAIAERLNGILKDEFGLDNIFESYDLLKKQVRQSIRLYNQLRPHLSIEMVTPEKAHRQDKIKLKTWEKKSPQKLTFEDSTINTNFIF